MAEYCISQHHRISIWRILLSVVHVPHSTERTHLAISSITRKENVLHSHWIAKVSQFFLSLLLSLAGPMQGFGNIVEYVLNTVSANGGFFRLMYLLLTGKTIRTPTADSSIYYTLIGHLDGRTTLHQDWIIQYNSRMCNLDGGGLLDYNNDEERPDMLIGELCIMAAKLAYENLAVVRRVVNEVWKMNFVGQYDCWNECQKRKSTKAFLFTDKAKDANLVVVAFRGTEPFSAYNWSTDFDFSWYEIPKLGQVHVGFLEALGLGDRNDLETFAVLNRKISHPRRMLLSNESISGLRDEVIADGEKPLAYDVVTKAVRDILRSNKNAKLFVTGHSLGAALSCLYGALLFRKEEDEVTDRLGAVYTFGQPRVGDKAFAQFVRQNLCSPVNRYFRVVYGSDIVARESHLPVQALWIVLLLR